jgi:CRISPR/Cas system-associated exonuclease Cas4 (RecB family)
VSAEITREVPHIDNGAFFSVTVPTNPHVAAAIQAISDDVRQSIGAVVSTVTVRRFRL